MSANYRLIAKNIVEGFGISFGLWHEILSKIRNNHLVLEEFLILFYERRAKLLELLISYSLSLQNLLGVFYVQCLE